MLMNEENEWDHRIEATVKEGPADCISMDEVAAALKKMKRHCYRQNTFLMLSHKTRICYIWKCI